jgi:hypothetical protein
MNLVGTPLRRNKKGALPWQPATLTFYRKMLNRGCFIESENRAESHEGTTFSTVRISKHRESHLKADYRGGTSNATRSSSTQKVDPTQTVT